MLDNNHWDIQLTWQQDILFNAQDRLGHKMSIDASAEVGGTNLGFRPMQTVLVGLAGCASIDIVLMLKKAKVTINSFSIRVKGEREADKIPSVFTNIEMDFIIDADTNKKQFSRFVELSVEKYCSVASMLNKSATIQWHCTLL